MRLKYLVFGIVGLFFMAHFAPIVFSEEEKPGSPKGWMKRLDYSVEIETDKRPQFYFETVQPLRVVKEGRRNFFVQPRISQQESHLKYSFGLGTRWLTMDDELITGINTFFDYQDLNRHYRGGLGLEALGKRAEARANYYVGASSKRLVQETASSATYEKAVDGFDVEAGSPLPFFPWVKLFGSYYFYDYKFSDDVEGWKLRGELKPLDFLTVDLILDDDNKDDIDYGLKTALRIPFEDFNFAKLRQNVSPKKEMFQEYDLKTRMLDPVEREFDIEVERYMEVGGIVVAIGRQ